MNRSHIGKFAVAAAVLTFSTLFLGLSAARQTNDKPETVIVTYHAKPGSEAELASVIAKQWRIARDLKLVREAPHVAVRGTEDGNKTYFVEIFTWRDASIPDSAPAAIQAIWAVMNKLVEPRGGKSGIDIAEVSVFAP
jgi:hypothetical protein